MISVKALFDGKKIKLNEKRIIVGEIGKVSHSILQELDKRRRVTFGL